MVRYFRLEVPAEVDGEAAVVPQRPAEAEARCRVLEVLAVRLLEVEIGGDVDAIGEAVVVLEAGAEEAMRLLVRVPSVGDERRPALDLVQPWPLGGRGIGLELEEVERPGRVRTQRQECCPDRHPNDFDSHFQGLAPRVRLSSPPLRGSQAAERASPSPRPSARGGGSEWLS